MTREEDPTPLSNRLKFAAKVGKNLRKLRTEVDVEQEELALALGYASYTAITHMESGRNQVPVWGLTTICRVLQCTVEELFEGTE